MMTKTAKALYARMSEYKHPVLVHKLMAELNLERPAAEALFDDVKRFMVLASSTDESAAPPPMVDKGWHQFILFTKDYGDFCHKYVGQFIHHLPDDPFTPTMPDSIIESSRRLISKLFGGEKPSSNWEFAEGSKCKGEWCVKCSGECRFKIDRELKHV